MTDGVPLHHRFPSSAVPHFNSKILDALSIIEPLHHQRAIKLHGIAEISFEDGMMRSRRRRPESIGVPVESGVSGAVRDVLLGGQISEITLANGLSEFFQPSYISLGQQPALVRRETEHQLATVPNGLLESRKQLFHGFQRAFIIGMPE